MDGDRTRVFRNGHRHHFAAFAFRFSISIFQKYTNSHRLSLSTVGSQFDAERQHIALKDFARQIQFI